MKRISAIPVLFGAASVMMAQGLVSQAGGPISSSPGPCLSPAERSNIEAAVSAFKAQSTAPRALTPPNGVQRYAFFPQAGTLWEDLFITNYVDLDPGGGIRDYRGEAASYNGHNGIDTDLVSFTEQAIGVPVYAVLDGTVISVHDGEPDMNIEWKNGTVANHVILNHGGDHDTWYLHLRNGSVAVSVGETVKAGQQLGLTASSGRSTGPHLHFESQLDGQPYEPFTGLMNSGESAWVNQPGYRGDTYLREFNITTQSLAGWPGPPTDTARTGHLTIGQQPHRFWMIIQNLPAHSNRRVRYLRPDGSQSFDSGTSAFQDGFGNPFWRWAWWRFDYNIIFDVAGEWTIEFSINSTIVAQAPLTITPNTSLANRAPLARTAVFDPLVPSADEVVFARLPFLLFDDPDYDVVRFDFAWTRNGEPVRTVTNAALSDALPRETASPGDVLRCVITPSDGQATAPSIVLETIARQSPAQYAVANGYAVGDLENTDDDADGLALLLEYFLDTSPTTPDVLPSPERSATGEWQWRVPTNPLAAADVEVSVEYSGDLEVWMPATSEDGQLWKSGDFGQGSRFFRLRVGWQAPTRVGVGLLTAQAVTQ